MCKNVRHYAQQVWGLRVTVDKQHGGKEHSDASLRKHARDHAHDMADERNVSWVYAEWALPLAQTDAEARKHMRIILGVYS